MVAVRYWRIIFGIGYLILFFWWSAMVVPTSNSGGPRFKGAGNLIGDLTINIIPYLALLALILLFWKKVPLYVHGGLVVVFLIGGILYKVI